MKKLALALLIVTALAIPALADPEDNQNQAGFGTELTVWENPKHKLQPEVVLDYEKDVKNDSFNFMAKVKLNVFNWLYEETH